MKEYMLTIVLVGLTIIAGIWKLKALEARWTKQYMDVHYSLDEIRGTDRSITVKTLKELDTMDMNEEE